MKGTKLICAALSGMLLAALAVPCSADETHTAETYEGDGFTLSYQLEDAGAAVVGCSSDAVNVTVPDRKSTRLNSSHRSQSRMPSSA